jgi:hypothetical protein
MTLTVQWGRNRKGDVTLEAKRGPGSAYRVIWLRVEDCLQDLFGNRTPIPPAWLTLANDEVHELSREELRWFIDGTHARLLASAQTMLRQLEDIPAIEDLLTRPLNEDLRDFIQILHYFRLPTGTEISARGYAYPAVVFAGKAVQSASLELFIGSERTSLGRWNLYEMPNGQKRVALRRDDRYWESIEPTVLKEISALPWTYTNKVHAPSTAVPDPAPCSPNLLRFCMAVLEKEDTADLGPPPPLF